MQLASKMKLSLVLLLLGASLTGVGASLAGPRTPSVANIFRRPSVHKLKASEDQTGAPAARRPSEILRRASLTLKAFQGPRRIKLAPLNVLPAAKTLPQVDSDVLPAAKPLPQVDSETTNAKEKNEGDDGNKKENKTAENKAVEDRAAEQKGSSSVPY